MASRYAPRISGISHNQNNLTGREPVIKGIGSKVLADRRGAYVSGNLSALVEMLADDQRLAFERWLTGVMVRRAQRGLPHFERIFRRDKRPQCAIEAAEAWLLDSTPAKRLNASLAWTDAVAATAAVEFHMPAFRAAWDAACAAGAASNNWHMIHVNRPYRRAMLRAAYTILMRGTEADG